MHEWRDCEHLYQSRDSENDSGLREKQANKREARRAGSARAPAKTKVLEGPYLLQKGELPWERTVGSE